MTKPMYLLVKWYKSKKLYLSLKIQRILKQEKNTLLTLLKMKFKYGSNLSTRTSSNFTTFQKPQTISISSWNTVLKEILKSILNRKELFLKKMLMIYSYKSQEVLLIYMVKKYITEILNLKISLCMIQFPKLLILVSLSLLTMLKTLNKKL